MIKDIPGLIKDVTRQIKEFTDVAVIGLSGGADSTLIAILCKLALGEKNVYGVHLPATKSDFDTFNSSSKQLAQFIKIPNFTINVTNVVNEFATELIKGIRLHDMTDKSIGNIKARSRMTALYAVCETLSEFEKDKRFRVIGTDNLSENFIGYFTKYGDGGVDINPIGELFKSEVYQLLDYFKDQDIILEEHINRIPSAGLWKDQTDEGELGFTYVEMEECIKNYYDSRALMSEEERKDTPCYKMVEKMHKNNNHKNNSPESMSLREYCDWRQ